MVDPQIIFEDKSILVLDKPAGLIVNRADTTASTMTLQSWLENYFGLTNSGIGSRAGIVHRLDKDTSGIIAVAKTKEAFENLQRQFKERRVEKKYLALVHGQIEPPVGVIRAAVDRSPFNRKKFGVFLGGREAETEYRVLESYNNQKLGKFCLVELRPKTGRTHQIRVHLKYINHPIVADEYYAGRKTSLRDHCWCPRQFLHAFWLSLAHPISWESRQFEAPVPLDLAKALDFLKTS